MAQLIRLPRELSEKLPVEALLSAWVPSKKSQIEIEQLIAQSDIATQINFHWTAYPNLKKASRTMFDHVGPEWTPVKGKSFVLDTIEHATISALQIVVEEGANTRLVVSEYLNVLGDSMARIATYRTLGYSQGVIHQWQPMGSAFDEWVQSHDIDRVHVHSEPCVHRDFIHGVKVQFLTAACDARDLGTALRYKG